MSYILDALRRADAERELGRVPGLHARTLPAAMTAPADAVDEDDDEPPMRPFGGRRGPLLAGAALAMAGLGSVAWLASRGDAPTPAPVASVAPNAAPTAAPPVTAAASPVAPPPPMATAPDPTPTSPAPAPVPREPRVAARETPPPRETPPRASPATPPREAPVARAPRPAPSPPAAVVPVEQLDAAVRGGLPTLSIGGAVHSADPASRMLIVNGVIAREGDALPGGVVLERIGPRSAVLRRGELRFSIRY